MPGIDEFEQDWLVCPEIPSHFDGLYLEVSPPRDLVAKAVQIPMMLTAQGHGELVTDLASEGSWLRKFQVMGIAGRALADETWLRRDEGEIGPCSAAALPCVWARRFWLSMALAL